MANAALARGNIFDAAAVTASSEASASTMAVLLQQPNVASKKWRSVGNSASIYGSYAANQSINTPCLFGTNFTAAATQRWRFSSSDPTCATGLVTGGDTGTIAGGVDPNYGKMIHLAAAIISGWKYFRCDVVDTSLVYLEAARGALLTRTEFTYPVAPGMRRKKNGASVFTETENSGLIIDPRAGYFTADCDLQWVDETQRWSVLEAIDLVEEDHTDILLIFNTASANLGRDSMWGPQVPNDVTIPTTIGDLYSHMVSVRERR